MLINCKSLLELIFLKWLLCPGRNVAALEATAPVGLAENASNLCQTGIHEDKLGHLESSGSSILIDKEHGVGPEQKLKRNVSPGASPGPLFFEKDLVYGYHEVGINESANQDVKWQRGKFTNQRNASPGPSPGPLFFEKDLVYGYHEVGINESADQNLEWQRALKTVQEFYWRLMISRNKYDTSDKFDMAELGLDRLNLNAKWLDIINGYVTKMGNAMKKLPLKIRDTLRVKWSHHKSSESWLNVREFPIAFQKEVSNCLYNSSKDFVSQLLKLKKKEYDEILESLEEYIASRKTSL